MERIPHVLGDLFWWVGRLEAGSCQHSQHPACRICLTAWQYLSHRGLGNAVSKSKEQRPLIGLGGS